MGTTLRSDHGMPAGEDVAPGSSVRARGSSPGQHLLANDVAVGALLTTCAGALDALAFFALGRAFAGIVTGNLVTAGYGFGTGNFALVRPTVVAVLATLAGETLWARLIHRRKRAIVGLLFAEFGLLLGASVGWELTAGRPTGSAALLLLAVISLAVGGQSIWSLHVHQTTTYFTGAVTRSIDATAQGAQGALGTRARQLLTLVAGALSMALVLQHARLFAPLLPLTLFVTAGSIHLATMWSRTTDAPSQSTREVTGESGPT